MVEGEIKFPDGTRYEGKLKNTKFREGEGTMYTKDNKIQFKGTTRLLCGAALLGGGWGPNCPTARPKFFICTLVAIGQQCNETSFIDLNRRVQG